MPTKEYWNQWNKNNPEKVKLKAKKWRNQNKENELIRTSIWQKNNRAKRTESDLRWARKNPEKVRNRSLITKYGITLEIYNKMFEEQNGLCYICQKPETLKHKDKIKLLSVDHDHSSGQVRKLLCDACNHGIGHFKENIEYLDRAKKYLEQFKKGGN